MQPDFYQFYLNTKVLFNPGMARDFSHELAQLGASRVLVVADPFLVENGVVASIQNGMANGGVEVSAVFSDIPPNSEIQVVKSCAALAQNSGADGMVVIGGGSAMDTAKAANILFTLGGDLVGDYSGSQTIPHALKPLVAIPTTAGTGSEVTSAAVIYDSKNKLKLSFSDAYLRPQLAILDPELTLSLPAKGTAMTGMDALTHAIEAYTSLQSNPMSDALAMKAVKLIRENLLQAIQDPQNLEVRSWMLIAANMAGIAFDHAMVGVVHAMAHAAGGIAHLPHGLANSLFLPGGMEYNLLLRQERYAALATRFGLDTRGKSEAEAARSAVQWVRDFRTKVHGASGLPLRLRDAGVKAEDLEAIARVAEEDGASFYNPRPVVADEILAKIKEAF